MTSLPWRASRADSFFKPSVYLAALGACNAASAMLMSWYIVVHVGVGAETDAFFASTAIPQFVFILLTVTLLPVLVPLLATRDDTQFSQDVWSFFWLTAAIFIFVAVVLYLTADAWVPLFVPGFLAPAKTLTANLTRIQLASMVLNALIVTLWAALLCDGKQEDAEQSIGCGLHFVHSVKNSSLLQVRTYRTSHRRQQLLSYEFNYSVFVVATRRRAQAAVFGRRLRGLGRTIL